MENTGTIESMHDAERKILNMANNVGKFAIEIGWLPNEQQLALERLQISGRIRLIDVSTIQAYPKKLFRIFLVSGEQHG